MPYYVRVNHPAQHRGSTLWGRSLPGIRQYPTSHQTERYHTPKKAVAAAGGRKRKCQSHSGTTGGSNDIANPRPTTMRERGRLNTRNSINILAELLTVWLFPAARPGVLGDRSAPSWPHTQIISWISHRFCCFMNAFGYEERNTENAEFCKNIDNKIINIIRKLDEMSLSSVPTHSSTWLSRLFQLWPKFRLRTFTEIRRQTIW